MAQVVTLELLERLTAEGHRTLVFSQSLGMLDVLRRALRRKGVPCLHMDGATTAAADRHRKVKKFQSDAGIPVFLLSAKARCPRCVLCRTAWWQPVAPAPGLRCELLVDVSADV